MILSKLHLYLKTNQFSKKMNSWKNQTIKNSMIWTIIKAWNIIFLIWRIKNDCWKVKNYSIHNTNAELLEPIFHQSTLFLDAKCLLVMLVRNLQIIIEKNVCIWWFRNKNILSKFRNKRNNMKICLTKLIHLKILNKKIEFNSLKLRLEILKILRL
jgi:hypothetical protein